MKILAYEPVHRLVRHGVWGGGGGGGWVLHLSVVHPFYVSRPICASGIHICTSGKTLPECIQ